MIHASNVFVPLDRDFKINGSPGLMVEHFSAKFDDTGCTVLLRHRVEK